VGFLLIGFVIMAPNGVLGLVRDFMRVAAPAGADRRAVAVLTIASYCFLVGLVGVVFGLSAAVGTRGTVAAGLGVFGIVLSLAYLAAAYGLLKIEGWSLLLATVAMAISIPLSLILMWLDSSTFNVVAQVAGVAASVVVIWYLQNDGLKRLYQPMNEQRVPS
jgi:hypothetical protein